MTRDAYLRAHRLEDVIFLIQYLGMGEHYSLEFDGKPPEGVSPRSSTDKDNKWVSVAKEHPEFFRVTPDKSISLTQRYYHKNGEGKRVPLQVDEVQRLIQNAISLQDRQAKRSEVWKTRGTFIAAVVAAASSFVTLYLRLR